MKKRLGTLLKIFTVCMILLCISGCWDRRELDSLSFVTGIGIDEAKNPNLIDITIQAGRTGQSKPAKQEGQMNGSAYLTMKKTGDNIFDTMREFTHENSRRLFFEHNQVIIFGKKQAEKGVKPYLDFFMRDHETRMDVWILVSDGTANDILSTDSQLEKIPSLGLTRLIQNQSATSESVGVDLLDFVSKLESKTTAPVASLVKLENDEGSPKVSLSGLAIFRKDLLVGELNPSETRGYLWTMNNVKSGIIDIKTEAGKSCLEISHSKSKIDPVIDQNGKITISLKIQEEGAVGELSGYKDMKVDQITSLLEKEGSNHIKNEVLSCLRKAQWLNADIYGFGEAVHRKYPKEWASLEAKWDQIFPTIKMNVEVQTQLTDTGKISKLMDSEEKKQP